MSLVKGSIIPQSPIDLQRHRLVTLFCNNKLGMQFAKIVCHIYFPQSQTALASNLPFSKYITSPDQYNNYQRNWDRRCYPRGNPYLKEVIHPSQVSSWPMTKINAAHYYNIVQPQILTQMLSLNT